MTAAAKTISIPRMTPAQVEKMHGYYPAAKPTKPTAEYRTIFTQARALGMPTDHRDDLEVIDRGWLAEHVPAVYPVFGWSVYQNGTDLWCPDPDSLMSLETVWQQMNYAERKWFFWDGTQLSESTPEEIRARLSAAIDIPAFERAAQEASREAGIAMYQWQTGYQTGAHYAAVHTTREKQEKAETRLQRARVLHSRYADPE